MTNAPFFSVITVCRNAERVLGNTGESLRAQSHADYEWIVIDGASSDNTRGIARLYLNPRRDIFVSEPDEGVYDAMNKGLRRASGNYVLFLNAGDKFPDDWTLETVRHAIDESVDVLHGDVLFLLPTGELIRRSSRDASRTVDRQLFASHQSFYIRRTVHLNYPFDINLKISADFAVIVKLYAIGAKFRYLPIPLSITTVEPHSISVKGRAILVREDLKINRNIRALSLPHAYAIYLRTRIKISIVSALKALPKSVLHQFPVRLRKRIY